MPTGRSQYYAWKIDEYFTGVTKTISIVNPKPAIGGGDEILHENLTAVYGELRSEDMTGPFAEKAGVTVYSFTVVENPAPPDVTENHIVVYDDERYKIIHTTYNRTRTTPILTILAEKAR